VSAASITPSAYLMPSTDVPVTMGLLRGGGGYARVGGTQAGTRFFSETARTPRKAPDKSSHVVTLCGAAAEHSNGPDMVRSIDI
jgi:hypothetical protein